MMSFVLMFFFSLAAMAGDTNADALTALQNTQTVTFGVLEDIIGVVEQNAAAIRSMDSSAATTRSVPPAPAAVPAPAMPELVSKYQCYIADGNHPPQAYARVFNPSPYAIEIRIGGAAVPVYRRMINPATGMSVEVPVTGRAPNGALFMRLDAGQTCYLAIMDNEVPARTVVEARAFEPLTTTRTVIAQAVTLDGVSAANAFLPVMGGCTVRQTMYQHQFFGTRVPVQFGPGWWSPLSCPS